MATPEQIAALREAAAAKQAGDTAGTQTAMEKYRTLGGQGRAPGRDPGYEMPPGLEGYKPSTERAGGREDAFGRGAATTFVDGILNIPGGAGTLLAHAGAAASQVPGFISQVLPGDNYDVVKGYKQAVLREHAQFPARALTAVQKRMPDSDQVFAGLRTANEPRGAAPWDFKGIAKEFQMNLADIRAERAKLRDEHPVSSTLGDVAGLGATVATGRAPFVLSGRGRLIDQVLRNADEAALAAGKIRPAAQAVGTTQTTARALPAATGSATAKGSGFGFDIGQIERASQSFRRRAPQMADDLANGSLRATDPARLKTLSMIYDDIVDSPVARFAKGAAARTGRTALEGAAIAALDDSDPLAMAVFAGGTQALANTAFMLSTPIGGKYKNWVTGVAAGSILFYLLAKGAGEDQSLSESWGTAIDKTLMLYVAGIMGGAAGFNRLPAKYRASAPLLADAINTLPRAGILYAMSDLAAADEATQPQLEKTIEALKDRPYDFAPEHLEALGLAIKAGKATLFARTVDDLMSEPEFRRAIGEPSMGTYMDRGRAAVRQGGGMALRGIRDALPHRPDHPPGPQ